MMADVTTRVVDVKKRIIGLLSAHTFLVGHSLENDLRGLELLHGRVLDTADLYPHPRGLPARLSLRVLAQQYTLSLIRPGVLSVMCRLPGSR
jgi:RNA exonuclease 1